MDGDALKRLNGIDIKLEASDLQEQLSAYPEYAANEMYNGLFLPAEAGANGAPVVDHDDDDDEDDDVIILHIDIRQPLRHLRRMLEQKIGVKLKKYEFWLQDSQMLEPHKNLVDQCVKGEGLVQINAQVRTQTQRINIVDVLKPTDDALAELSETMRRQADAADSEPRSGSESPHPMLPDAATIAAAEAIERELNGALAATGNNNGVVDDDDDGGDNALQAKRRRRMASQDDDDDDDDDDVDGPRRRRQRDDGGDDDSPGDDEENGASRAPTKPQWIIDMQFKREQIRLKMSDDPKDWTQAQVKHWLQWAVRHFNLTNVRLQDWAISGKELNELTLDEFNRKVPSDPQSVFWTHLELLRRLKIVAIQGTVADNDDSNEDCGPPMSSAGLGGRAALGHNGLSAFRTSYGTLPKAVRPLGIISQFGIESPNTGASRTGNNGQIQLWQFLLEILTDREHRGIIIWMGTLGEFKLIDPERVAQLWGERKNKSTMNYEKLSRALRYYYDGDMISKVPGKRFVYKFICDLTQLIGYSAQELSDLVNERRDDEATSPMSGETNGADRTAASAFGADFKAFMDD